MSEAYKTRRLVVLLYCVVVVVVVVVVVFFFFFFFFWAPKCSGRLTEINENDKGKKFKTENNDR